MLSTDILSTDMLSTDILYTNVLNVVMLTAIMLNVVAPDLALPVPANPSTLLQKVCNDGHRFGKRSLGDNVDTADAEMSIYNDGDTSGKLERFLEGRSLRFNSLKSSVATNLTSLHLDLLLWRI
jgi:hypothetical protein